MSQPTIQTIAQQNYTMMRQNFLQPEVGLFYMYADPYAPGKINLPTKEQVEASIPCSNGFSTPLENMNYASSQFLDTLIYRYQVTRKPEHAEEARNIFKGLRHLYRISKSPSFVPRGVLPDMITHYKDVSIDHISFWLMSMWRYYRSPISSHEERRDLRKVFSAFAADAEKHGWTFRREDGLITFWANLNDELVPRAPLVFMFLLLATYDCTADEHWRDCYLDILNRNDMQIIRNLEGQLISSEVSWVSSQSSWLLDCLYQLEDDADIKEIYRLTMIKIARSAKDQLEPYSNFDWQTACRDFTHRSLTHRNCLFSLICVAMCPDAAVSKELTGLAEKVIRHYDYRRDGKIIDLLDSVVRYYWIMASRGLQPYDPSLDIPQDGSQVGIPRYLPYQRHHDVVWYDAQKEEYIGCWIEGGDPNFQFFYQYDENKRLMTTCHQG